ncbi:hypothetical protein [Aminobacter aminovorans]|uniref:hypothetical protein n=1 Tax=Aminobacter aminovorans TaxID=83263 RepID=UPI0028633C7D|nr:hypothetical protein [Aminobacter aminovorans]MDR7221519.1 hypothetical protein [Aminobacter aminovorans]
MPRFIENVAASAAQIGRANANSAMIEVLIIATIAAIPFAQQRLVPKSLEKGKPQGRT